MMMIIITMTTTTTTTTITTTKEEKEQKMRPSEHHPYIDVFHIIIPIFFSLVNNIADFLPVWKPPWASHIDYQIDKIIES